MPKYRYDGGRAGDAHQAGNNPTDPGGEGLVNPLAHDPSITANQNYERQDYWRHYPIGDGRIN